MRTYNLISVKRDAPVQVMVPTDSEDLGREGGGNLGVFKIDSCGEEEGPFIIKECPSLEQMNHEKAVLNIFVRPVSFYLRRQPLNRFTKGGGRVVAYSPDDSPDACIVMLIVPGCPLQKTEEYANAMELPKDESNRFLQEKHRKLAYAMVGAWETLAEAGFKESVHGDFRKTDNIHWSGDPPNDTSVVALLDWEKTKSYKAVRSYLITHDIPIVTGLGSSLANVKENIFNFALHMAQFTYPFKK
ncbi:hypothetical protein BKA70DRAFT_1510240 [Coprinopsis sp. MPI-PUGE-AT-0042]|nr:hypothetical protein BKA70DRAFT_1510240 [Coprinopsis sp. MPI-PUGE-AT-0042]